MGNIVGDCFLKETVSRAYKPGKIQLVEKMSQLTCFFVNRLKIPPNAATRMLTPRQPQVRHLLKLALQWQANSTSSSVVNSVDSGLVGITTWDHNMLHV